VHWGAEPGIYPSSQDVGDVLEATIDIPDDSYIVVTAYNEGGESGYSNEVFYQEESPLPEPPTNGIITWVLIEPEVQYKLGRDYEMVFKEGKWIIIHNHLDVGDTVRMGY